MAALDTNVLVRLLVQDNAVQGARARRLVEDCIESGEPLFVPVTVLLELAWVLRSAFGFDHADLARQIAMLLGSFELRFEFETAVEAALRNYRRGGVDFADCLHAALATQAGETPLWTFDKAAARMDGVQLLTV